MDPSTMDPPSDEESLMAQAMGFTSFGDQSRPQKKRRYNPNADAIAHQAPQESSSGANSTALGTRTNANEIGLDGDDDDDGDDKQEKEVQGNDAVGKVATDAQVRPAGLPQRLAHLPHNSGRGQHRHDEARGPWYEGYYDPMSNENPWDRIEKERGLESRGTWIPRETTAATSSKEA